MTSSNGECPRCANRLGPIPIYLGKEGEGHICGDCWTADRIDEEYPPRLSETLSPDSAPAASALKQNTVFVFDDGVLTIKQSGYGRANGWAELAFHERQVEVDADGYHKVEIRLSELKELRDFLIRALSAGGAGMS